MRLFLVGSSHANRIREHLKRLGRQHNVNVTVLGKSGATFEQLNFPSADDLTEEDILLIFPFGNNCFKRGSHFCENKGSQRTIHLSRFDPIGEPELNSLFQRLENTLSKFKCKVFIVDSFYKYVKCCSYHELKFPRYIKHQKWCNALMKEYFADTPYSAVNHLSLLSEPQKMRGSLVEYKKKMVDSVHFEAHEYQSIAENIFRKIIVTNQRQSCFV